MVDRQAVRTLTTNGISIAVLIAVGWLVYREATRAPVPQGSHTAAKADPLPATPVQPVRAAAPSPTPSAVTASPRSEPSTPPRTPTTAEPTGDREELNRLRLRLAEVERERDDARAEAARFERALERAVAEMNAQELRHGAKLAQVTRPAPAVRYPQPNGGAWISVYSVRAEVLADRIIVFGDVRNIGNVEGGQRIARVRLLEDGREVESQQLPFEVGLHTDVPIQATFYRTPIAGVIYSARIDVES